MKGNLHVRFLGEPGPATAPGLPGGGRSVEPRPLDSGVLGDLLDELEPFYIKSPAPVEEAGEAIVAKIQRAAELANETCDRAMKLAHKLSMDLRAAEDRINQLEAEVQLFRDRSARAEGWLQTIYKEIEEKLIAPRSGSIEGRPMSL